MLNTILHEADLCIVGGGMAGTCAAIAAARNGIKTLLMHERPMLGGNASSEIRMWICGAHGENNRETGIIEEICLESLYKNPDKSHYLFDCLLLEKVYAEKNLTLLLNCSCMNAEVDGNRIVNVTGWQSTTQTFHKVVSKLFADCSGDSILAPLTGAEYRFGREAAEEFGEKISVTVSDRKTMGISCLIQGRLDSTPSRFTPPAWAEKLTEEQLKYRRPNMNNTKENFWYLEYGGDMDCIGDTEEIRDKLLRLAMGMWDYVKNSGEVENADYWRLEFLGFLPAKRESRRMMGKYLMTQNDIMGGKPFHDTVAFGGWGLDDHNPRGFYHKGKINRNEKTPAPYCIPYRCLYSKNISNLFFAGRNISMTHAAMSSIRVMATCATLGEAVGTAAALAVQNNMTPDEIYHHRLEDLQQKLMYQDCFLPHFKRKNGSAVMNASLTVDGRMDRALDNLRNGIDRNNHIYGDAELGYTVHAGSILRYRFEKNVMVNTVRITFDSDLDRLTLPGDRIEQVHITRANIFPDSPTTHLPSTLVKEFEIVIETEDGSRTVICHETENRKRTVWIPVGQEVKALSLIPIQKWYDNTPDVHLFSFDFV